MPDSNPEPHPDDSAYQPRVRWVLPNRVDFVTFMGKDVFIIAHDIYIVFFNLKTHSELVYVANSQKNGDGVDVVAGHRSNTFAFAEKVKHGRIFIVNYPAFNIVAELRDKTVNRYKGLCMMECELVAGFSGFPNYVVSVWNWRTHQRLVSAPTGVVRRSQIYMASRTHMLICECWGEGLIVWEVAQCYKRSLLLQRAKQEVTGWEVSEPPLVGVCWSGEGQLYAIDPAANLYSVLSDGIGMVTNLEWSENLHGKIKPCICAFGNGFLIYGPDKLLRALKKAEHKWKVAWSYKPLDVITRLVANATCDLAAMWARCGLGYKITGESEDKLDVKIFTFKQRNIIKVQLIAPDYKYVATMNDSGVLCIYEAVSAKLVAIKSIEGNDISFEASPVEPLLAIFGEVGPNYGLMLAAIRDNEDRVEIDKVGRMCLTHQIVSLVAFSPTGREMVAAAMSAGHIFVLKLSEDYKLSLVRYTELGRGLADCFLMKVGDAMRCFSLVLFSDKYAIGERIICINAETGKDNKFAGKMQGPYAKLMPLAARDTMLAIPHLTTKVHVLKLAGDKGVTVSVKMGPMIDTGHEMKQFSAYLGARALLTYGYDGAVILRRPDFPEDYELKLVMSHRYESGVRQAVIDADNQFVIHLAGNRTVACAFLHDRDDLKHEPVHEELSPSLFDSMETMIIIGDRDKNYLDLQEDKKVHEEAMDYKRAREEVLRVFDSVRARLVALLEENLAERPLHQLSLAEFNLHHEHRKERLKQVQATDCWRRTCRAPAAPALAGRVQPAPRAQEGAPEAGTGDGLLEENLAERPLHQLSLAEFNLHHEHRKERLKQVQATDCWRRPGRAPAAPALAGRVQPAPRAQEGAPEAGTGDGLLEQNLAERPLHQLSLAEFNLHHEHRKERLKQAEREREELRLATEARIRAQDKVTRWIRERCWDTMLTPRVKLFAIFSHYQVENYAVLPTQRDLWPELQQTEALRGVEMDNDDDLFRPWEEPEERASEDHSAAQSVYRARL
ncbi:uncharacterized protein LOC135088095 [Ostrinia nubilalis]|uniref:uncharacterized protein LOC135088095 n=1 Tax=Ostrinia nubilalis TaxID=29057 RepID=UPI00308222FD